jgi:hypothetical protein
MRTISGAAGIGLLEFHGFSVVRTYSKASGRMECWNSGMMGLEMETQYSIIPKFQFFLIFLLDKQTSF